MRNKNFKLFVTVCAAAIALSQDSFAIPAIYSQQNVQRAVDTAQTPEALNKAYQAVEDLSRKAPNLAQQLQAAKEKLRKKSAPLPMVTPGVIKPPHLSRQAFEAIAKTPQFKDNLTIEQQQKVLTDLDAKAHAGGRTDPTPAEIKASVTAVMPAAAAVIHPAVTASVGAVSVPLQAKPGAMHQTIYDAIVMGAAVKNLTNAQKNAIVDAVLANTYGVLGHPAKVTKGARDQEIITAVTNNQGSLGGKLNAYKAAIIAAVDAEHPVLYADGELNHLTNNIYNKIRSGALRGALPSGDIPHVNTFLKAVNDAINDNAGGSLTARSDAIRAAAATFTGSGIATAIPVSAGGYVGAIIRMVNRDHSLNLACPVGITDTAVFNAMTGPAPHTIGAENWEISLSYTYEDTTGAPPAKTAVAALTFPNPWTPLIALPAGAPVGGAHGVPLASAADELAAYVHAGAAVAASFVIDSAINTAPNHYALTIPVSLVNPAYARLATLDPTKTQEGRIACRYTLITETPRAPSTLGFMHLKFELILTR